jgi:outer membrane protein assembly factor BamB
MRRGPGRSEPAQLDSPWRPALGWTLCILAGALLLSRVEIELRDLELRWLAVNPDAAAPPVSRSPGPSLATPQPAPTPTPTPGHLPAPPLRFEVDLHPPRQASRHPVASPAWDGSRLYVAGERALLGVSPDGDVVRHDYDFAEGGYPFVADGRVWMLDRAGNLGRLAEDGFRGVIGGSGPITGPPAVGHEGEVHVPGGNGEVWTFSFLPTPRTLWRGAGRGAFHGVSVGADGTVYGAGNDRLLRAFARDGSGRWGREVGRTWSAPAIDESGRLYLGTLDGRVLALDPFADMVWVVDVGSPVRGPAVVSPDGRVYVGSEDGRVHAIDRTGRRSWSFLTGGALSGSAAVAHDGTVYLGSHDGRLYALHPDGTEKWSVETGGAVGSPNVLPDGTVVFASADGRLRGLIDIGNGGLAAGGWPKWARDLGNGGRAVRP